MRTLARAMVMVVVGTLIAGGALAQFAKPEDAIKYRKVRHGSDRPAFQKHGGGRAGQSRTYDSASTSQPMPRPSNTLATLPWKAFLEPGTDKGDTTMSSAVFEKKDEFHENGGGFPNEHRLPGSRRPRAPI